MTAIDAKALIAGDLAERRRERLQHFRPAWLLAALVPLVGLVATGVRPDLWRQPPWILGLQGLVWALALLALPALGLGLWFPGRAARIGLGLVAAAVAVVVAGGPALFDMSYPTGPGGQPILGCAVLTLAAGALVLAVCALSGAFAQRRRRAAALWLAGAIALIGVDTTTWHCKIRGLDHTLPSHLGAGVLLLLVAGLFGAALHRRQRGDRGG